MYNLLSALNYIHSQGIIHRDIKVFFNIYIKLFYSLKTSS